MITGKKNVRLRYPEIECVRPGKAEGTLTGGNLTMLQHLIGTPYDWSGKDAILFIEDTDEVIYKIAERLQQMKLAGKFKGVRAVIVGEMVDIADGRNRFRPPPPKNLSAVACAIFCWIRCRRMCRFVLIFHAGTENT